MFIEKPKPKQPIFTTTDGKEVYEGDRFVSVDTEKWFWLGWMATKMDCPPYPSSSHKYFSNEEAANIWIDENKPKYSKKDILKWLEK